MTLRPGSFVLGKNIISDNSEISAGSILIDKNIKKIHYILEILKKIIF